MITTCIERIKPGTIFKDSRGYRFIKLMDKLPSGLPYALRRVNPVTGENYGDFTVNAIYLDSGGSACCPYSMDIFIVDNQEDIRTDEEMVGIHTVRHIDEI